jgi:hypothetical protein
MLNIKVGAETGAAHLIALFSYVDIIIEVSFVSDTAVAKTYLYS